MTIKQLLHRPAATPILLSIGFVGYVAVMTQLWPIIVVWR